MKIPAAVALLISSSEAAKYVERQAVENLMQDPSVLAEGDSELPTPGPWSPSSNFKPRAVEHCPDFDERMTLVNGKTRAIPYPKKGWNCNPDWGLAQTQGESDAPVPGPWSPSSKFNPRAVEHCPDFDERFTLNNGKTRAIPYPLKGWNCNPEWGLAQVEGPKFDPRSVEHCPDFDERFTLNNGRTRAVPYPKAGWNCNPEWSLSQAEQRDPVPGPWSPSRVNGPQPLNPDNVEQCPDFNERFTLRNGRTRAIPWPRKGWNCNNTF